MNPRVKDVIPIDNYCLQLTFSNGEQGVYDCSHLLTFGVFRELIDCAYFRQVKVEHGTVVWPHEQDICPDTLYEKSSRAPAPYRAADARIRHAAEASTPYGSEKSPLERAKGFYAQKEYDCCALMLCKELENILKAYLLPREQRDKNCNELDLAGLIAKAKARSSGDANEMLAKLDIDRRHILNPLVHDDHRNTYSEEIRSALKDVEMLKELLK